MPTKTSACFNQNFKNANNLAVFPPRLQDYKDICFSDFMKHQNPALKENCGAGRDIGFHACKPNIWCFVIIIMKSLMPKRISERPG